MQLPSKSRPFRFALVASCAALLITATPIVAQQVTDAGVPAAAASAGVRVLSGPGSANHAALILAAALSAAGRTPVAAPPAADVRHPVDESAPLAGPRVRPEQWGVEPGITEDRASALAAAAAGNNTIVISTLAIVLIAVIITILVVK